MRTRAIGRAAIALALLALAAYLYDPPWTARITSGLRSWEEDPPGTRFRWTFGRATFFIPSDATAMTLPLRSVFPGDTGGPVAVDVRIDDRFLATIQLTDPAAWVRPLLPIGPRPTSRRYRRVDLRISRVVPPFMLGVMAGEVVLERPSALSPARSE
jgi:hypothetical protein